jgi:hypothetical protein
MVRCQEDFARVKCTRQQPIARLTRGGLKRATPGALDFRGEYLQWNAQMTSKRTTMRRPLPGSRPQPMINMQRPQSQ